MLIKLGTFQSLFHWIHIDVGNLISSKTNLTNKQGILSFKLSQAAANFDFLKSSGTKPKA